MKSQSNLIALQLPKAWDFPSLNRSSDQAQQKAVKEALLSKYARIPPALLGG